MHCNIGDCRAHSSRILLYCPALLASITSSVLRLKSHRDVIILLLYYYHYYVFVFDTQPLCWWLSGW